MYVHFHKILIYKCLYTFQKVLWKKKKKQGVEKNEEEERAAKMKGSSPLL